jgi:hypothetical protein
MIKDKTMLSLKEIGHLWCYQRQFCLRKKSTISMQDKPKSLHTSGILGFSKLPVAFSPVTTVNPRACASAITHSRRSLASGAPWPPMTLGRIYRTERRAVRHENRNKCARGALGSSRRRMVFSGS